MRRPPRPRGFALLNPAVLVRAYLVLGLMEAIAAMAGYLLVWRANGVDLAALQHLAPCLLYHTAPPATQAIQDRASTVAFCLIVAGQMGALLACRSDRRPFWERLAVPNSLLWAGFLSEPLVAGTLILVPPLAAAFGTAPFSARALALLPLSTLLVLAADTLHKRWRWRPPELGPAPQGQRLRWGSQGEPTGSGFG